MTIRNGTADYANTAGGAMSLESSTVTIDGVDFVENLAPGIIFYAPGSQKLFFSVFVRSFFFRVPI
jgi:hypothetical protein